MPEITFTFMQARQVTHGLSQRIKVSEEAGSVEISLNIYKHDPGHVSDLGCGLMSGHFAVFAVWRVS